MIPRIAQNRVLDALQRQAAVALLGPRQVGKTTLAWSIADTLPAHYLDLESREDREKLSNPALYLSRFEDKLVILDEIHRLPELFPTLRGVIDQSRRRGRRTGRFLILGSASMDLLRQSGESLAGRIAYVEMDPLTVLEIPAASGNQDRLWVRGGFPDSFLAASDAESFAGRKDFIRTYLERDIPMFGPRIPTETLERLWTMLAHAQGTLLNASLLARNLMTSAQSITRYLDLLVDLLLVRRLPPYHTNRGKRLVKSPKIYVRDSGLTHTLLGIGDYAALSGHPVVGLSWEGFVLENLLSGITSRLQAFFYRTSAGAEIDLVLEMPSGALWAIEIKRGLAPRPGKGFHQACEDLTPERSFVVYSGDERYPITESVEAIGLRELASLLAGL